MIRPAPVVSALALTLAAALLPACETLDGGTGNADEPAQEPVTKLREIRLKASDGAVMYRVDAGALRTGGDDSKVDWYRDGSAIRRGGKDGKKAYHFAKGELRQSGPDGPVLLTFRAGRVYRGASTEVLFTIQGRLVHRGTQDGPRVLWLSPDVPDWAVAMALQGLY
jgi:hypothetical protein